MGFGAGGGVALARRGVAWGDYRANREGVTRGRATPISDKLGHDWATEPAGGGVVYRVDRAWPGARPRPVLNELALLGFGAGGGVAGARRDSEAGRGFPVGLQLEGRGSGEGAWLGGRGARALPGRRGRRRASRCVLARPRPQSAPATARAPWFPARRVHSCGPSCWGSDWPCWASRPGSGRQVRSDGGEPIARGQVDRV